ncbi:NUDIX hydrolase [Bacillus inaquosorum]|uniref:NUDIX hydrolase n=1 Tax=Bacillus inaquosorum TaxID=483913 RepID=UPI00227EF448|nr:NUDIX hydrolase [Bacillus inaquosorum]MCY8031629.1 NUDIX hydrolase [Bacillus inaquosorum]MCY8139926.1 NUDIX hydrolase [Bacillus inaquosorum]MCY8275317.1 NUDIX hydrolase [Bacillus inaquosorum]MCY8376688.1 NUDIX hydrolase [Bacillus inaquosorum]MCY8723033.1 NUDIX hydrolase [Bacillus inaquosorum]
MYTQGAFVIVLNENQQILLVKRKDVPLWDLPGGRVDPEETAEAAAVREVLEETGYTAALSAKIGVYQRPKFQDEQHVFAGNITGGRAIANGMETAGLKWFSPQRLPFFMVPNRKKQISDFKNGDRDVNVTLKDSGMLAAIDLFKRRLGK